MHRKLKLNPYFSPYTKIKSGPKAQTWDLKCESCWGKRGERTLRFPEEPGKCCGSESTQPSTGQMRTLCHTWVYNSSSKNNEPIMNQIDNSQKKHKWSIILFRVVNTLAMIKMKIKTDFLVGCLDSNLWILLAFSEGNNIYLILIKRLLLLYHIHKFINLKKFTKFSKLYNR